MHQVYWTLENRQQILNMALRNYQEWKRPSKFFDTPKHREVAKALYHRAMRLYRKVLGHCGLNK